MTTQNSKKVTKKATAKSTKVSYEPNKVGLAVAILASVTLVLLGLVAMQ